MALCMAYHVRERCGLTYRIDGPQLQCSAAGLHPGSPHGLGMAMSHFLPSVKAWQKISAYHAGFLEGVISKQLLTALKLQCVVELSGGI